MKIKMCDEFYFRIEDVNNEIYRNFNTSYENVYRSDNNLKMYKGEWIKIKVNDFIYHHVKPAETLKDIADVYNVSIEKIKQNNNLENDKLFIGQKLKLYKE